MIKRLFTLYPVWFTSFLTLLALMPLPFGSNRPWASALMGLWTGATLLLEVLRRPPEDEKDRPLPRRRLIAAGILYTIPLLWAVIQGLSFTPEAWHHPLWMETASITGAQNGSIALNPDLISISILHLLTYAGLFFLALRASRVPDQALATIKILAWAGGVYALYGLLAQSFGGTTILWYKKWAYEGFLSSTFVNKNSYAAYAGLGLLCALALLWQRIKHSAPSNGFRLKTPKLASFLTSITPKDTPLFLLPFLFLTALFLTGSRAGVTCALLGCFAFLGGLALNRKWGGRKGIFLFVGALLVVAALGGLSSDGLLLGRTEGKALDQDTSLRLAAYQLEINSIFDNPWLGFGLGGFENAFRLYRDSSLPEWFQHAHNDYLEAAMELGLPAALSLLAAVLTLISCVLQGTGIRQRREIFPILALAASLALGLHSLVDFGFQIPAIAGSYAALLGLGVGQSSSSEHKDRKKQVKINKK